MPKILSGAPVRNGKYSILVFDLREFAFTDNSRVFFCCVLEFALAICSKYSILVFDLHDFALTDDSRVFFLGAPVRKCELLQMFNFGV